MKHLFITALIAMVVVAPNSTNADRVRGLENYLKVLKGERKVESFSATEIQEIVDIHERLGTLSESNGACDSVIESRIDGEFEGWEGETVFKLMNGQIWQQVTYSYTYRYDYMPEVLIYPSRGFCMLRVEGIDEAIAVQRLK